MKKIFINPINYLIIYLLIIIYCNISIKKKYIFKIKEQPPSRKSFLIKLFDPHLVPLIF